jgi:AcrR family transcriptional regulator
MAALAKPKPLDRMRASGQQYLRFALERPRDYRVIFMSEVASGRRPRPDDVPDPSFQFLVDRVRECMDSKVMKRGEPREVAVTIWAHVHGLVSLHLSGHLGPLGDERAFAAFFTRSTDDLLAGLRA